MNMSIGWSNTYVDLTSEDDSSTFERSTWPSRSFAIDGWIKRAAFAVYLFVAKNIFGALVAERDQLKATLTSERTVAQNASACCRQVQDTVNELTLERNAANNEIAQLKHDMEKLRGEASQIELARRKSDNVTIEAELKRVNSKNNTISDERDRALNTLEILRDILASETNAKGMVESAQAVLGLKIETPSTAASPSLFSGLVFGESKDVERAKADRLCRELRILFNIPVGVDVVDFVHRRVQPRSTRSSDTSSNKDLDAIMTAWKAAVARVPIDSVWRHYKGQIYRVHDVMIREHDLEPVISYQGVNFDESRPWRWERALSIFVEYVQLGDGSSPRRFEPVLPE
jgi:hypothetical protein